MAFRPPAMQPAFYGATHAVLWIAALAAILILPILTTFAVSPDTRYLVMSKRVGPSDWHASQILKETAPLDILLLGNSRMLSAIDHAALRDAVRRNGTPLKSETIAANFNGYDLTYTFLTDFFAHRRAKLIVINYPDFPQTDSHPAEKYLRRLGRPDPGLDIGRPGLAIRDYAEMALIGPRLALATIIPPGSLTREGYRTMEDFPDLAVTDGTDAPEEGYQESRSAPHAAFVKPVPDSAIPAVTIQPGAPLPAGVVVTDRALTPIESAYLPAIKSLCAKNGAVLALMLLPIATDNQPRAIEVSNQALALGIPIIATSLGSMFGEETAGRREEFYSNYIHFNANGARQSAKVYGPALQALVGQAGGS